MACVLVLASCSDPDPFDATTVQQGVEAVTITSLSDGSIVWADRTTGTVHVVGRTAPVATVPVDSARQGGMVGLVADERDRLFIAWVDPDRQLSVAAIDQPLGDAALRPVWDGVPAPSGGLGGRLAFDQQGVLIMGLGNGADTSSFGLGGGAMVRIDPDGAADQTPQVISSGWNNPFAFAVSPSGQLWVADNHPSDGDDRLARADLGPQAEQVTVLPNKFGASGLAAISDTELWVCSYVTGRLDRYRINDAGVAERSGTVAGDCRLDVTVLADGRVAYSSGDAIRVVSPVG